MVCESCNTRVDPDRFCTNCGAPLLISDAPVAEPVNVGRIILYGLLGVGVILVAVAGWKLYIDGYYPEELVPFLLIGAAGLGLSVITSKILFKNDN